MNLLTTYEEFTYDPHVVRESITKSGGKLIMSGVLQRADTLNQNGRVYPLEILEREVRNYQKFIIERRALGELDHPDDSVVNLKNVSHTVLEATMEDGVVRGRVEVLETPSGQILRKLVESGIKIGISSRGVGTTKKDGDRHVVQDDFQLICFDFVSEPSTPNAFLLPEGKRLTRDQVSAAVSQSDRVERAARLALSIRSSSFSRSDRARAGG